MFWKYRAKKLWTKFLIITLLLGIVILYPILCKIFITNNEYYSVAIICYITLILTFSIYLVSDYSKYFSLINKKKWKLNDWVENIYDENPIFTLLGETDYAQTTIENLIIIKEKITDYCEHDNVKLRLLKSYYSTLVNNQRTGFWYSILGLIVVITGYLVNLVMTKGQQIIFWGATLKPQWVITLTILIIIITYNEITSSKNKTLLIYNILEELVDIIPEDNKEE